MKYVLLNAINCYEKEKKCDLDGLKTIVQSIGNIIPGSIERKSLHNINANSIFLIGKLDWDNSSNDDYPLLSCLSTFVNKICTAQNAHAGLIMKQAWRLFSICVFTTVDERLVQAASLIESCIRLACVNYCTNGDISSCNDGMKLLFFQKKKDPKKNWPKKCIHNTFTLDSIFNNLSYHCKNCSVYDFPCDIYPCYDILNAILDDQSLLKPIFIRTENRNGNEYYWNRGQKILFLADSMEAKPFSLINNLSLLKPLSDAEFKKIKKTRNALAHGNFKMPNENAEPSSNIYNNEETIIQSVCDMLVIAYVFLHKLTFELYLENQTPCGPDIIVGKELIKYVCGISIYSDDEIKSFPSKEKIIE